MSTTFENAKVGDKVYSLIHGWGQLTGRVTSYEIEVRFERIDGLYVFDRKGFYNIPKQVLFWSEPEIIAPEQPKPKKTIQMTGWINIYPENVSKDVFDGYYTIYSTEEEAEDIATSRKICTVKVTSEPFEVDE